ncbi:MAG: response regulator transcription factor [Saprospiraceae bacterium]
MKDIVFRFGLLAGALLLLFQISKYSLFFQGINNEWKIVLFAALFLLFGYWSNRLLQKSKTQIIENQIVNENYNTEALKRFGISKREHEVLQEIARGLSNQEIAAKLYISESTVKTHVSNLLIKLDAKRRTQAVSNAKKIGII